MSEALTDKSVEEYNEDDCIRSLRMCFDGIKQRMDPKEFEGQHYRSKISIISGRLRCVTTDTIVGFLARRMCETAILSPEIDIVYNKGLDILAKIDKRVNDLSNASIEEKPKTRYDILKARMDTPMGMAKVLLGHMDDAIRCGLCGKMNTAECQTCSPEDVLKVITVYLETEVKEDTFMLDGIPYGRGGLGE